MDDLSLAKLESGEIETGKQHDKGTDRHAPNDTRKDEDDDEDAGEQVDTDTTDNTPASIQKKAIARRKRTLLKYINDVNERAFHHNHRAVLLKRGIQVLDVTNMLLQAAVLSSLASTYVQLNAASATAVLVMQSVGFVAGMGRLASRVDIIATVHATNAKQYADLAKTFDSFDPNELSTRQINREIDRITRALMLIGDNETYRLDAK